MYNYLQKTGECLLKKIESDKIFYQFKAGEEYRVKIESREYQPQKRTIKTTSLESSLVNFNFPKLQFSKYEVLGVGLIYNKISFFTITSDDNYPVLPNICNTNGICCLGGFTGNNYIVGGKAGIEDNLPLEGAIRAFWLTKFVASRSASFSKLEMYPYKQVFPNLFNSNPTSLCSDFKVIE